MGGAWEVLFLKEEVVGEGASVFQYSLFSFSTMGSTPFSVLGIGQAIHLGLEVLQVHINVFIQPMEQREDPTAASHTSDLVQKELCAAGS